MDSRSAQGAIGSALISALRISTYQRYRISTVPTSAQHLPALHDNAWGILSKAPLIDKAVSGCRPDEREASACAEAAGGRMGTSIMGPSAVSTMRDPAGRPCA